MADGFEIQDISKLAKKKTCDACGYPNAKNASKCKSCGKSRFAPNWIIAKRPISRWVSVEITKSNPAYGEQKKRITLSKWWPGGRSNYNVSTPAQWERIKGIIDTELGPILGWKTAEAIVKDMAAHDGAGDSSVVVATIWKDHPDLLKRIVEAIDPSSMTKEDFSQVVKLLGEVSDALTNANAGFREAFLAVVQKLPAQKKRALEDLDLLLQGWSLQAITNVAHQVKARLETIQLFEYQIQDPMTYEIQGDNSIHRILERSMWLIDERYWLLFSNSTLRKFIGDEMSKRDQKRYGKKRPDFVCGSVGNKLIILELKRPAHDLVVDDLNQLETYLTVAEDYTDKHRSYEAYLVGNKIDPELSRRMKHRSRSFKVLTYSDIVDDTKKRYREFLDAVDD